MEGFFLLCACCCRDYFVPTKRVRFEIRSIAYNVDK